MSENEKKTSCINVRLHSSIKNDFVSSARKMGMTLTEYLEDILINKEKFEKAEEKQNVIVEQLELFTENKKALELFKTMKGQKILYFSDGKKCSLKVEKIEDLYQVLIEDYHSKIIIQ